MNVSNSGLKSFEEKPVIYRNFVKFCALANWLQLQPILCARNDWLAHGLLLKSYERLRSADMGCITQRDHHAPGPP